MNPTIHIDNEVLIIVCLNNKTVYLNNKNKVFGIVNMLTRI